MQDYRSRELPSHRENVKEYLAITFNLMKINLLRNLEIYRCLIMNAWDISWCRGVTPEPSPVPRKSLQTNSSNKFGSVSSLSSLSSAGGTSNRKKKKPAPVPPRAQDVFSETLAAPSVNSSRASSPCTSLVS